MGKLLHGAGVAHSRGGGGSGSAGGPAVGGGGSPPVDRCPEVCDKLEAKFATFGCIVEECNCKAACADVFEASIDCLPDGAPECTCNGNELDCGGLCQAENQAASDCFVAN